ncbi:hypothetical protein LC085_09905 [Bacillus tianshenii]|uniref:lipopolysaccharide biosynthesis protein n=1 Tax=Sutcliffiella tianshenii TaxID=1463404 RepID=UPI001CD76B27|nr:hypothetical protein [Bacillus tianshenii]MCA1320219.1 hypothetical protein [Bacillus tianshenii]
MERIKKMLNNDDNRNLFVHIVASFIIKGIGMCVSVFSMPLYIKFFDNNVVLGVWFTILSLLSWITLFDLGLGNGLRNKLTEALTKKDYILSRKYISSTYAAISIISLVVLIIGLVIFQFLDLNKLLNIPTDVIRANVLKDAISILYIGVLINFVLKLISSIIYAVEKSSFNNIINLIVSILPLIYISFYQGSSIENNLINLSIVYSISINVPFLTATILMFLKEPLNNCYPDLKFFKFVYAKEMLTLGGKFFLVQIFFMLIISTNEIIISKIYNPSFVVDYNIYYKLFTLVGSIFMLGLTPLWSHVTKSLTEGNYQRLKKINKSLYFISVLAIISQFIMVPFMQTIVNLWLGENAIEVNYLYALIFAGYGGIFILNVVVTTLANGMGELKTQIIFFSIGCLLKLPMILILKAFFDSWVVTVLTNFTILFFFCIFQIFWINKKLDSLIEGDVKYV